MNIKLGIYYCRKTNQIFELYQNPLGIYTFDWDEIKISMLRPYAEKVVKSRNIKYLGEL